MPSNPNRFAHQPTKASDAHQPANQSDAIDKLWAAEAKRRRDDVRQGRAQTIPGEEALAKVRRSIGR